MRAFSERNPVRIAVVGVVALVALGLLTFYSDRLPFIDDATTYTADFHDASGLHSGDDVMISGVTVGKVDDIALSGDHVRVVFGVDSAWIGDQTTAAIKIQTLLGQEFLALNPQGATAQDPHHSIPTSRTTTPIDVADALSHLATTTGDIDTSQLSQSFEVLAQTFAKTPAAVKASLTGLTALARTISSRDNALASLAANASDISSVLASNNANVTALITDGKDLLAELEQRSAAITQLLSATQALATQISGLISEDGAHLHTALSLLTTVTATLTTNKTSIGNALHLIGPYYAMLTDAVGNGHWLDVYICGLFDASDVPLIDATAVRNCTPAGAK